MTEFSTEDGNGSYDAGVLTLPEGRQLGIEAVLRLTVLTAAPAPALPDLLGSLRGALPSGGRLSMPMRFAVSTVRAGLGVIEEGLMPQAGGRVAVEIVLADHHTILARMPPALVATMGRDREMVLAALARSTPSAVAVPMPLGAAEPEGTAEALTSIFRYEKRNGRLRRVVEPDRKN